MRCFELGRHYNAVVFLTFKKSGHKRKSFPCVGLILSLWRSSRKPKLVTAAVSMKHVVCARVAVMDCGSTTDGFCGVASDTSVCMIIRPMSIVAVLDIEKTKSLSDGVSVVFSDDSQKLVESMDDINKWWPAPDPEAEFDFTQFGGAPVTKKASRKRKGKRKTANQDPAASAGQQDSVADKLPGKHKASKKSKKKKSHKIGKRNILKKANAKESISCVAENFRRNAAGRLLIKQTMQKVLDADQANFTKNPFFDPLTGACLINVPECKGMTWQHILDRSPEYFRVKFLDFVSKCFK